MYEDGDMVIHGFKASLPTSYWTDS